MPRKHHLENLYIDSGYFKSLKRLSLPFERISTVSNRDIVKYKSFDEIRQFNSAEIYFILLHRLALQYDFIGLG